MTRSTPRRFSAASLRWALPGLLVVALGLWPIPARTQDGAQDETTARLLSGTWRLAISADEAQAAVDAGIATATAALPPLVDALAARQLRARLPVSASITLTVTQARIEARFGHASFASAPGATERVPVPGDPAATMGLVQVLRNGHLEQIFTTDGGRRWTTFTPSADGARLTLDAVVHSERLPADVRFRIPYRRSP